MMTGLTGCSLSFNSSTTEAGFKCCYQSIGAIFLREQSSHMSSTIRSCNRHHMSEWIPPHSQNERWSLLFFFACVFIKFRVVINRCTVLISPRQSCQIGLANITYCLLQPARSSRWMQFVGLKQHCEVCSVSTRGLNVASYLMLQVAEVRSFSNQTARLSAGQPLCITLHDRL